MPARSIPMRLRGSEAAEEGETKMNAAHDLEVAIVMLIILLLISVGSMILFWRGGR